MAGALAVGSSPGHRRAPSEIWYAVLLVLVMVALAGAAFAVGRATAPACTTRMPIMNMTGTMPMSGSMPMTGTMPMTGVPGSMMTTTTTAP